MKKQKSFTLIEILVVIAILGILVTIVTAVGLKGRERAKRAAALQFSSTIHNVLGAYLVGEWLFDEGTDDTCSTSDPDYNDICDTSGEGNHGGLTSEYGNCGSWGTEGDTPSSEGCAFDFSGDGYFYTNPSDSFYFYDTDAVTIEFWAYPEFDVNSEYRGVLCSVGLVDVYFDHGTLNFGVYLKGGSSYTYISSDSSATPLRRDKWLHFAGTYDGTKIKMYVDGKEAKSNDLPGELYETNGGQMCMGVDSSCSYPYCFKGKIDEARIYKEALTSAQIKKLYVEGAEKHGLLTVDR